MHLKGNRAGLSGKILAAGVILLVTLLLIWIGPRRDPPAEDSNESHTSEINLEADSLPPDSPSSRKEPSGTSQAGPPDSSTNLTVSLASYIRAEYLPSEQLNQTLGWLNALQPQSELDKNIIAGAEAFLREDYQTAEKSFEAARLISADDIYLPSFLAATALGADQAAEAESRYLKALVAKSGGGLEPIDLSDDQIGLALSLFWLGRPEQARPLAEHAWQSRRRHLGSVNAKY